MKFLKVILTLVTLFSTFMLFNMYRFNYGFNDGFWRTLLSPMEGTVWASNFSEAAFLKVKIGMSSSEVKSLLGDPLRKSCDSSNICFWNYSWQDSGTADFDQRWVVLNNDFNVIEIRKSFFID